MIPSFAMEGDEVIYLDRNGYDIQREQARKFFTRGETYRVAKAAIGGSSSEYYFDGIRQGFNSVMFEFADIDQIIQETEERREQRRVSYQASMTYQEFPQILGMVPDPVQLPMRPIEDLRKPALS